MSEPASTGGPECTVVLPCYNEAAHVEAELDRIDAALAASGLRYEILAIDDASSDGTLDVLRSVEPHMPSLRVLPFTRNGGSGTARRIGTQTGPRRDRGVDRRRHVLPERADPRARPDALDDRSYDQVVGARRTEEGTHKWLRTPAKWFIRKVAERLTNQRIPDLNSGLRAFRRDGRAAVPAAAAVGFSCVTTITLAFLHNQHDIKYVPIDYAKRAGK